MIPDPGHLSVRTVFKVDRVVNPSTLPLRCALVVVILFFCPVLALGRFERSFPLALLAAPFSFEFVSEGSLEGGAVRTGVSET